MCGKLCQSSCKQVEPEVSEKAQIFLQDDWVGVEAFHASEDLVSFLVLSHLGVLIDLQLSAASGIPRKILFVEDNYLGTICHCNWECKITR